jgi:hypothetical protein
MKKFPIGLTVDVENLSGSINDPIFADALRPLLDALEESEIKATFFVVGTLAPVWAKQLHHLHNLGHEIGLHGHTHEFLSKLGPKVFAKELIEGKNALQDILGQEVFGFRAPYFSLTQETAWAPDIIQSAGFKYSSSVLPAWNPQSGYPRAPRRPFMWPCGLVEFPVPTFGVGSVRAPLLGGAYLRLSPKFVFAAARFFASRRSGMWSYCHPYDFDTDAKFERVREQSMIVSKLVFLRRRLMLDRVLSLCGRGGNTFQELVTNASFLESLDTYYG